MKKKVHKTKGQFKNPSIMGSRFRGCLHGGGGLQVCGVNCLSIKSLILI